MFYNTTTLYNPSEKDKGQLIDEFVVRTNSFNRIFNDILTSKNIHPEQHYLLVGQRGSGKTTLLYRLKYAIEDDPNLKEKLIALNLGEEQYAVSELCDLWETLAAVLDDYYNYDGLSNKIRTVRDKQDGESRSWEIIHSHLEARGQSMVVFIDNFGDLLKKFADKDVKRMREVLMTSRTIRLIAGTPFTLESVFNYSEPFFEFFNIIHLKGLSHSETIILLRKLAETHNEGDLIDKIISDKSERIEILRRLTGGVIRTMVLLFKVFVENMEGKAIRDLQSVLDSVTPLYKHRMDDLPTQQQKIIDAVAKNWDAISVKEIAKISRITSKNVSAQLRQLEKSQMIEKIPTDSKNHLYHLKERFFNIWYLMRYGRKYDKKRVIWLVKFLESWCEKDELENRVIDHIENLNSTENNYDKNSALLIGEAYLACKVTSELKEELLNTIANKYPSDFDKSKYDLTLEKLKEAALLTEKGDKKGAYSKIRKLEVNEHNYRYFINFYLEVEDYTKVEEIINSSKIKNVANSEDYILLGSIYHDEVSPEIALKYYNAAIKKEGSSEIAYLRKANILYKYLKNYEDAEVELKEYIKLKPNDKKQYFHELAHIEVGKRNFKKAEDYFKRSIQNGREGSNFCLGAFYHFELEDFEKAEKYYLESIDSGSEPYYNLGVLYAYSKKKYDIALEYFEKAIECNDYNAYYEIARIYKTQKNNESKALKYYEKAVKVNDERAYHPIAHLYSKLKSKKKGAEKFFKRAIEIGDEYAGPCLALFYLKEERVDKKSFALELVEKGKRELSDESYIYEWSSRIYLWNEDYENATRDLEKLLEDKSYIEDELDDITDLMIDFIALKLYYPILKMFDNDKFELKSYLKPVYYALMTLMKDKFPNEYLKMGSELAETVSEILKEVDKRSL